MKRIVLWLMSTLTVLVLLFGYRTSTNSAPPAAASSAIAPYTGTGSVSAPTATNPPAAGNAITVPDTAPTGTTSTGTTVPVTTPSGTTATATTSASDTVFTGDTASTRWGDVQVAITVTGGQITAVTVPEYPTGNQKDQQINARALPVLVQETISAQSADIDMVSGATVTSEGYLTSLQSALDRAGL